MRQRSLLELLGQRLNLRQLAFLQAPFFMPDQQSRYARITWKFLGGHLLSLDGGILVTQVGCIIIRLTLGGRQKDA
ncbi:hypothetical protein D3C71_1720060 [compost metagenome]